jgi:hypothetical protein
MGFDVVAAAAPFRREKLKTSRKSLSAYVRSYSECMQHQEMTCQNCLRLPAIQFKKNKTSLSEGNSQVQGFLALG